MIDLEKEGGTKEQVLDALRILPFVSGSGNHVAIMTALISNSLPKHPAMKRAVTSLQQRDPNTAFLCLSNSNTVYIDTILSVRLPVHRSLPISPLILPFYSIMDCPLCSPKSSPTLRLGPHPLPTSSRLAVESQPTVRNIHAKSGVSSTCVKETKWKRLLPSMVE
jgi:hypothetical protein